MNLHYFIDENVLASLLKRTSEKVWQTVYAHYRAPFVSHLKQNYGVESRKSQELFQEVFALLVQGLKENLIKKPLSNTIFTILVKLAEEKLASDGYLITEANTPAKPNLAGEALVLLIRDGHEATFSTIVKHYQTPLCKALNIKYYFVRESPIEIMGETLMVLKKNIEAGKLALPLRSRLFTYTYRIARNKFLEFDRKMKKVTAPLESEEELESIFKQVPEKEEETTYFDHISDLWPVLSSWLEDPDQAFEQLIAILDDTSKEILRLRFEEGLKAREIGERINRSEGAVRKRLMDILKKWRRLVLVATVPQ